MKFISFSDSNTSCFCLSKEQYSEVVDRKINQEFIYFVFVAKGSCGEVRSMLILAQKLNKIKTEHAEHLQILAEEISRIISGLIKTK